ncbi:MAG: coproporphyrinogen III oxidase, partial [Anaerolineae bacterium]
NISIDLMYDLPSQTRSSFKRTLSHLPGLPITHLSLYNLTIEPNTSFFKRKNILLPKLPTPQESLELLEMATDALAGAGLVRYEISAFAKHGLFSRHNSGYWTGRPFLGLGPSAFSYWDKRRFRNVADLKLYEEALYQDRLPIDFEECLAYPADVKELLAINLRLLEGVDLIDLCKKAGPLTEEMYRQIDDLKSEQLLEQEGARIRLSEKGLLFYDSVAEALI